MSVVMVGNDVIRSLARFDRSRSTAFTAEDAEERRVEPEPRHADDVEPTLRASGYVDLLRKT